MDHYKNCNFDDFLSDESFRSWVWDPSPELSLKWDKVIQDNPHQAETIQQARIMLLTIDGRYNKAAAKPDFKNSIRAIVLAAKEKQPAALSSVGKQRIYNLGWLRFAAAIVLLSTVGIWFYMREGAKAKTITRHNNSLAAMTILLSDSSMVILESGSTLVYPSGFSGSTREVTLQGEAFFEIRRNESKPFFVFANQTVTKVLGTSFRVSSNGAGNSVTVSVKTGKVAVFAESDAKREVAATVPEHQVLLVANEQVVIDHKKEDKPEGAFLKTSITGKVGKPLTNRMYEDVPVPMILHALELEYGISILYDKKILSGCLLNTQFDEEFLQQKILTICKAIGATYEISEGYITIKSNGCS
jgi:transmembrane sensor